MKITVAEIAKQAGVSPATVSRVMSGGDVSEEKRNAVLAVLNLHGAVRARTRKKRGSEIRYIGLLFLDQSRNDSLSMLSKLTSLLKLLPNDWRLLHLPHDISPFQLELAWKRRDISGLILSGHDAPDLNRVLESIPNVWLNSHVLDGREPEILAGNELAGRLAARHLIAQQVRNPLILDASSRNPGFHSRIDGFRFEYFTRFGAEQMMIRKMGCSPLDVDADELERALDSAVPQEILSQCDGVFAPEARLAALMHRLLRKRGKRTLPPMVTCNHGEGYLTGLYPRPATIDLGPELLARLAFEQLMAKINGDDGKEKRFSVVVDPRLIPGD